MTSILIAGAIAAAVLCPVSGRSDCVHDGDTWWLQGVKYRHVDIDTPEITASIACGDTEIARGIVARDRLIDLMAGGFDVESTERRDKFDRILARIRLADGREAGAVLLAEGLAVPYPEKKDWCAVE